ncbi:hypothetical protein D3C81_1149780 [compost metagenome]
MSVKGSGRGSPGLELGALRSDEAVDLIPLLGNAIELPALVRIPVGAFTCSGNFCFEHFSQLLGPHCIVLIECCSSCLLGLCEHYDQLPSGSGLGNELCLSLSAGCSCGLRLLFGLGLGNGLCPGPEPFPASLAARAAKPATESATTANAEEALAAT